MSLLTIYRSVYPPKIALAKHFIIITIFGIL